MERVTPVDAMRRTREVEVLDVVRQLRDALRWHYEQGHSDTVGGFRLKIDQRALRDADRLLRDG